MTRQPVTATPLVLLSSGGSVNSTVLVKASHYRRWLPGFLICALSDVVRLARLVSRPALQPAE